jgi:hypothetical protein
MSDTKLKEAILSVLANVSNYPPEIQAKMRGADVANLTEKTFRAIKETGLVEEADKLSVKPDVTRVELIVNATRDRVIYGARDVSTALQDEGRTLKVFLTTEG